MDLSSTKDCYTFLPIVFHIFMFLQDEIIKARGIEFAAVELRIILIRAVICDAADLQELSFIY